MCDAALVIQTNIRNSESRRLTLLHVKTKNGFQISSLQTEKRNSVTGPILIVTVISNSTNQTHHKGMPCTDCKLNIEQQILPSMHLDTFQRSTSKTQVKKDAFLINPYSSLNIVKRDVLRIICHIYLTAKKKR